MVIFPTSTFYPQYSASISFLSYLSNYWFNYLSIHNEYKLIGPIFSIMCSLMLQFCQIWLLRTSLSQLVSPLAIFPPFFCHHPHFFIFWHTFQAHPKSFLAQSEIQELQKSYQKGLFLGIGEMVQLLKSMLHKHEDKLNLYHRVKAWALCTPVIPVLERPRKEDTRGLLASQPR